MESAATLLLSLSLLAVAATYCDANPFLLPEVHIEMTNYVVGGPDVTIHCKSKNDDLGEHLVQILQSWDFTFRPNYWLTTQFYCSFKWQGVVHWFDIYMEDRDYHTCTQCQWAIREKQICRFRDKTGAYDECYDYNSS